MLLVQSKLLKTTMESSREVLPKKNRTSTKPGNFTPKQAFIQRKKSLENTHAPPRVIAGQCLQYSQGMGKTQLSIHTWTDKNSVLPKKGNAKECSNHRTIALISHTNKIILKILQARLQQYMNHELPDVQAGFRKGRGTRDQIANIHWIIQKAREFQKNIYFCFIDYAKAFDCMDYHKLWENSQRDGNTRPPDSSWETCMQVRKQQLKLDMEQQTGSKSGKEYLKAVYCHPAYLTYMQSTSWETLDWKKHKKESRLPGEISITSDMQMTPPLWHKM